MRLSIALIAIIIPIAVMSQGWDESDLEKRFSGRQLAPIEGVWQFPGDGAKVAIVASVSDTYDIYLIDSPLFAVKPGVSIGYAIGTPTRDIYDARLETEKLGKMHKSKSHAFKLTVTDGGTLIIDPYKTGYTVSMQRLFYRLFKISVIDNTDKEPKGLKGAKRVYPYRLIEHLPICL